MKAKLNFFLYGTLAGVFISSLIIVLIHNAPSNVQSIELSESLGSAIFPTDNTIIFQISSCQIASLSLILFINASSLKELKTLPRIGDEKAKSIIDFHKKYGNFISVEEHIFVPSIGNCIY